MTKSEYMKQWRAKNKKRIREYQNNYRAEHGRLEKYTPEYYQENRERILANHRKYRQNNKDKENARQRDWRRRNPVVNRLRLHGYRTRTRGIKIIKEEISNWESKICGICNQFIEDNFEIDHIIPLSRGGKHAITNLQLAHRHCNRVKHNKLPSELIMV